MDAAFEWIAKFFGHTDVNGMEAMGIKGLHAILALLVAFWIYRLLRRAIDHRCRQEHQNNDATINTYIKAVRLVVMVPGILLAIHLLGINLSSIFTAGGLITIALAFAMKNISENLISGIMLRFESTISPGDVLETDGAMVRVKKVGFRATTVRTKDEKDLLIPNSQLIQDRVANYTYRDSVCRVWTYVGVSYSSNLNTVCEVLQDVCNKMVGLSEQHAPEVLLTDFGASSVNYKVSVWVEDPWIAGIFKSNLNEAIWWALKDAGIAIAFPQLDVHFDEAFTKVADLRQAHMEEEQNE